MEGEWNKKKSQNRNMAKNNERMAAVDPGQRLWMERMLAHHWYDDDYNDDDDDVLVEWIPKSLKHAS